MEIPPAGRRGSKSVVLADLPVVFVALDVVLFPDSDADLLLLSLLEEAEEPELVDAEESELVVVGEEDLSEDEEGEEESARSKSTSKFQVLRRQICLIYQNCSTHHFVVYLTRYPRLAPAHSLPARATRQQM